MSTGRMLASLGTDLLSSLENNIIQCYFSETETQTK